MHACMCTPQGTKGSRCLFLGKSGKLLTTGFSKKSDRQFAIW
jgi:coronin-2